jgi:hypothetical protein
MNLDYLAEYVELFIFNENVYYKKDTTSQFDFIKKIIDENYEECIKLIYGQDIGISLDGRGTIHNELSIYNRGGPFYVNEFNLTYKEYHEFIEEINNYANKKDPRILANECFCNWEHNEYLNPHSIEKIDIELYYYKDHDELFKRDFYEMLFNSEIIKKKMYSDKIISFIDGYITNLCKVKINIL